MNLVWLVVAALATGLAGASYVQRNLVSDLPGLAPVQDPLLVNPWGLSALPGGALWAANNGAGVATIYNVNATVFPATSAVKSSLEVLVPPFRNGSQVSAPTGVVANTGNGFSIGRSSNGTALPARFLFCSEDGRISGWNPAFNATAARVVVDHSSNSSYKALTLLGNRLYVTNFKQGVVEVYDESFNFIFSFTDDGLPAYYSPFGVEAIGGQLFVSFALRNSSNPVEDVPGEGNGYVSVFNATGRVAVSRLIAGGRLNSPFGMALAPSTGFGEFSGMLLVGNFGDGRINAYWLRRQCTSIAGATGLGTLTDCSGKDIVNDGLWTLRFGVGGQGGNPSTLFFTAGIQDEEHGLLGSLLSADQARPST